MLEKREQDGVVVVEMAHGKVNALDLELLHALIAAFRETPAGVPIVLTGRGRAFCAGVDLQRLISEDAAYAERFIPALSDTFLTVFAHPAPVVAAINGHALAGGCVIAAACDVRLATAGPAQLGVTELVVGVAFPTAAMEILRHALGDAHAARLVYTGQRVSPDEAHRLGLVTDLVDADTPLLQAATTRAAELGRLGQPAYRLAKTQLRRDALDRIARHRTTDDVEVVDIWAAPETMTSIQGYLSDLQARRA